MLLKRESPYFIFVSVEDTILSPCSATNIVSTYLRVWMSIYITLSDGVLFNSFGRRIHDNESYNLKGRAYIIVLDVFPY